MERQLVFWCMCCLINLVSIEYNEIESQKHSNSTNPQKQLKGFPLSLGMWWEQNNLSFKWGRDIDITYYTTRLVLLLLLDIYGFDKRNHLFPFSPTNHLFFNWIGWQKSLDHSHIILSLPLLLLREEKYTS